MHKKLENKSQFINFAVIIFVFTNYMTHLYHKYFYTFLKSVTKLLFGDFNFIPFKIVKIFKMSQILLNESLNS